MPSDQLYHFRSFLFRLIGRRCRATGPTAPAHMAVVRVSAVEAHGALVTLERLHAPMAVHVRLQLRLLAELRRAELAGELQDAKVDNVDVLLECSSAAREFAAATTGPGILQNA